MLITAFEASKRSIHQGRTCCGIFLIGILAIACAPSASGGDNGSGSGGASSAGSGGSSAGSGGSSSAGSGGSSSAGSGGSSEGASGGSSGSGGSVSGSGGSSTGGATGSATGGSGGGDDANTGAVDAPGPTSDSGPGTGTPNPNNQCFTAAIPNRMLSGLSAQDFCDGYEKYCKYTPDGTLMSKCGPGQPVGPLFKDRMDCEAKYTAASATAKACRAGQMCRNGKDGLAMGDKGANLIVNACSHATGYCAGACK